MIIVWICYLCAIDCPGFRVKAKVNVSVPSGFINRPKSTDFYIKRFLRLVHSVDRTRFDDDTKKSDFKYLDFLVQYANVVFFHCSRK